MRKLLDRIRESVPSVRMTPEFKQAAEIIGAAYVWHFGAVGLLWLIFPFHVAAIIWFLGCLATKDAITTMQNTGARRY